MSAVSEFRSFLEDAESPILDLSRLREKAEAAFKELDDKAESEMKTIVHVAENRMDATAVVNFRTMLRNYFGPRTDRLLH